MVEALNAGADDYVTKSFRLTELLARLRAHLRRRSTALGAPVLTTGRCASIHTPTAPGSLVLRPKEFDVLHLLVEHASHVVTRDTLITTMWDEHWYEPTETLDVHVSALHHRLAEYGEDPYRITIVRGRGYRFESQS